MDRDLNTGWGCESLADAAMLRCALCSNAMLYCCWQEVLFRGVQLWRRAAVGLSCDGGKEVERSFGLGDLRRRVQELS